MSRKAAVINSSILANKRVYHTRGQFVPLAVFSVITAMAVTGCGHTSTPAVSLSPPITSADQTQIKTTILSMVTDLDKHEFQKAESLTSPAFKAAHPASTLQTETTQGVFASLVGSTNWSYSSFESMGRGTKELAHCQFTGSGGIIYHTNIITKKSGSKLLIDSIVTPEKPRVLVKSGA